jgi:hypothetical protein
MSKNMVELEKPEMTSQYCAYELHAGSTKLYARARTHTRLGISMHAPARTHTQKYVVFIAFPRQELFANASEYYSK